VPLLGPTVSSSGLRDNQPARAPHSTLPLPSDALPERQRTLAVHLGVILLLVGLALLAWWRVWVTGHPTSTITCDCGDPSQELWLFAWIPYAIGHGTNPLFTGLLETGQGGVNIMWDANNLLAAFALAPVTTIFGPVASFNVAAIIAPVLSGWCFFLAAGRISRFVPGQIAGAVLYAFSPFIVWNSAFGHANLTWLFCPPLFFILARDLWVQSWRRPATIGRWTGILIVVQFLASTEVLVITAIGVVIGCVLVVAGSPRKAWALRTRVGTAAGWAAAISLPLLAYPVWYTFAGPRHISGRPWSTFNLQTQVIQASSILRSTGFHQSTPVDHLFGYYGALPPTFFVGGALLAFLAVSVFVWRRDPLAWLMVGLCAVTILFSLGSNTVVVTPVSISESGGHWWMPWRLFAALPILRDLEPNRFVIVAGFAVAMLVTISADRWWNTSPTAFSARFIKWRRYSAWLPATIWGTTIVLVLAGVLWSVADVYDLPFVVHRVNEPTWFARDAPGLSPHTRVLVLPTTFRLITAVMSWQAESALPYSLEGGYAVTPRPPRLASYSLAPIGAAKVLDQLSSGVLQSPSEVAEVKAALRTWAVGVIALEGDIPEASSLRAFIDAVVGTPPRQVGTWWIWRLSG